MAVRLPVDPNENLDSIISKITSQSSKDVILVLPQETRALQELNNFYALRTAVRNAGVNLSFAGGNKTIRGLAKLLGFQVDKEGGVLDEEDTGTFANVPTAQPGAQARPFDLPEGFVVANPGGNQGAADPRPASADASLPPPRRTARDFFDQMGDFTGNLPAAPLQPPPSRPANGNGNGNFNPNEDQRLTRENIPTFFDAPSADGGPATRPPAARSNAAPPEMDNDRADGSPRLSYEEAMSSGLFNNGRLGDSFTPSLDEQIAEPMDDDVPVIPGDDTAASRFRTRGGVRNSDDGAGSRPARRRILGGGGTRAPRPVPPARERDNRAAAAIAAGTVASSPSIRDRVRGLLVPVQPRAGGITMAPPTLSPEKQREREAQRRRTTLYTLLGVLLLIAAFALLMLFLFRNTGGNGNNDNTLPPPIALTVPLKTKDVTDTLRIPLLASTPSGATALPSATTAAAATSGAGTPGAVSTLVPTEAPGLPVKNVNTGEIKKSGEGVATGLRPVPDKFASGPVTIINAGFSARGFSAGTQIFSRNGVAYRLRDGITVSGTNQSSLVAGRGNATIVADKAGTVGNTDGATIALDNNIRFQVGKIEGGTDKQEKFIQQGDLDSLKKSLADQASGEASSAARFDPSTQAFLVLKSSEPNCQFNKKAGDSVGDDGKFTGTCTTALDGAIYNKADATNSVKSQLVKEPGYRLDDKTPIEFQSDPKLSLDAKGNRFLEVRVKGRAIPTLDVEAFKTAIASKTKAELPALLARDFPQVDSTLMSLDGISSDTMPLANRLDIKAVPDYEFTSSTTVTAGTPGPTGPSGTNSALPSGGNSLPRTPLPLTPKS